MSDLVNAFSWVFANIHAFGWITLIILAWRASSKFTKFTEGISKSETLVKESSETITKVATNHLPHLQEGIDNVNSGVARLDENIIGELRGIRSDLLQYALRKD